MKRKMAAFTFFLLLAFGAAGEERIDRRRQALDVPFSSPQGLYQHYCAHCHGDDGSGSGRLWATELAATPADLTATALDEAALLRFIRKGGTACPPWERTIPPRGTERLTRHVLALAGRTAEPAPMAAPLTADRESFPWFLLLAIAVEIGLLGAFVFRPHSVHQSGPGPDGPYNEGERS